MTNIILNQQNISKLLYNLTILEEPIFGWCLRLDKAALNILKLRVGIGILIGFALFCFIMYKIVRSKNKSGK